MPTVTSLDAACREFEGSEIKVEDDRARIARIISVFEGSNPSLLSVRDVRYIAAAIGSYDAIDERKIFAILQEVERRRDSRLTRAVFKALLASYSDENTRALLRNFVASRGSELSRDTQQFCEKSGVLKSDGHLASLATQLVEASNLTFFCVTRGIASNILSTRYGHELKIASIKAALAGANVESVKRTLDWAFSATGGTPTGDFYEVCLSPFQDVTPRQEVQTLVMSVLVRKFGDPRIREWPLLVGAGGARRREGCLTTIRRWLSIEYLDLFIRIIEETAVDHQFAPRKRFWLRYFEKGVISDLTLVLASDATSVARRTRGQNSESEYMKWSSLTSSQPNQSVLLMRLGDLIIAEWSHSGAMRFWRANSKAAPRFHRDEYTGSDLRTDSIKVQTSSGYRDSIIHSANGQWMTAASDAIEFHTGVRI